ncbi:MAG: hypothetical protein OXD50_09800 [Chloroflexi bacterium]|nr:hypothetical protein [Chloroflexota bacterium]
MGSRIGSIAILLVIAAIVAAVVVVISRLDLLNTGGPDAPVMVVSLDEGELVLLNQPQSITVTISSGNPIATLELFVDSQSVVSVLPSYSQDRGAWIGTFVWTPTQLGFADVQIVALDDQGVESQRQIRVEVTDDQARVAAALRVQVLGIVPLQQFVSGTSIRFAISATGSQPIERFDMLVNDEHIVSVTPVLDESGDYIARIEWTPGQTGEVQVTIVAVDVAGRKESQTIPVILIPQGGSVATPEGDDEAQESSAPDQPSEDEQADFGVGIARIESPTDGQRFTLDSNLAIDVELIARNVGAVASALLYITPIAPDNTLGNSVLIHSSEGHGPGDYSELITDVQRFITSSGSYELQLVVFTPEKDRYDDRIVIHIVAVADQDDEQAETGDGDADSATQSDQIDLVIVTARQVADDRNRLNVSVTNTSSVDIERANVLVTVINASNGAELASAAVTFEIESAGVRTIPLDLDLEPGITVEARVLIEAAVDTNTNNNEFLITLQGPEESGTEESQDGQAPEADSQDDQQEQTVSPDPGPAPDLTFLDAQATSDGYVLLTVINNGDGPAETFFITIADQSGAQLEVITRRDADAQPLAAGSTEILTSLQPHSGTLTITVVAGGDTAEANTADNEMTLEIPR